MKNRISKFLPVTKKKKPSKKVLFFGLGINKYIDFETDLKILLLRSQNMGKKPNFKSISEKYGISVFKIKKLAEDPYFKSHLFQPKEKGGN